MALAAAAAWVEAGVIDEQFVTGPVSRRVRLGDAVIVTGEWTWDGGHSGWNEIHATHTLQKVVLPERTTAGFPTEPARQFVERWCRLVAQVPTPYRYNPGTASTMTPAQAETHDRQQRPEHQWTLHPAVDGCRPSDDHDHVPTGGIR
jgi:hypothetical protein